MQDERRERRQSEARSGRKDAKSSQALARRHGEVEELVLEGAVWAWQCHVYAGATAKVVNCDGG